MPSSASPAPLRFTTFQAVAADIKLAHTVFALPFALLAMMLAAGWAGRWPTLTEVLLIAGCMVAARTAAMTANRAIDAPLDATNPRTAGRAVPAGRVSRTAMTGFAIASSLLLIGFAAGFWLLRDNPWPLALSPVVLVVLLGYPLAKRLTWLCHVILGLALALSPLAAALAIEPGYLAEPAPWLLAAIVLGWVAGFDVIYALLDVASDRATGVRSMPASLGEEHALWISRTLHLGVVAGLLALLWVSPQLGRLFAIAAGLAVALLVVEHVLVWRPANRRIEPAFFTVNGIISILLGAAGIADIALHL